MRRPADRTDPARSDRLIAEAPEVIRSLFEEFEFYSVTQALERFGLNAPPSMFSAEQVYAGAMAARNILEQDFVDLAPSPIRRLLQEYNFSQVIQALKSQGIGVPLSDYSDEQIDAGVQGALKILEAESRIRIAPALYDGV